MGLINGILAFIFGFAMIWYIWWLAIACALGMLAALIFRATDDDTEYTVPEAEVARIENLRYQQLAGAKGGGLAGGRSAPQPLPQV